MRHIVTSKDGVQFVVESEERSVAYDQQFASRQPAAVLETHGDFTRLDPLQSLVDAYALSLPPQLAADLDALSKPRRPQLRLIQGGKS